MDAVNSIFIDRDKSEDCFVFLSISTVIGNNVTSLTLRSVQLLFSKRKSAERSAIINDADSVGQSVSLAAASTIHVSV